jgi:hypothetical protein
VLIEREADQQRERLFGEKFVRLLVAGEVEGSRHSCDPSFSAIASVAR